MGDRTVPMSVLDHEERVHSRRTHAIEAEDLIAERIFYSLLTDDPNHVGTYVDIGAYDAIDGSNTYLFYKRGWRGICVEPNPAAVNRFALLRPEDQFVPAAVGPDRTSALYYEFDAPMLNGCLTDAHVQAILANGHKLIGTRSIEFRSLPSILGTGQRPVDFLNIDVEGAETDILQQWDFTLWPVRMVCVEIHSGLDVRETLQTPAARLLMERGFTFISRLWHSSLFIKPRTA
jgi:FkbM family methyltransferase